MSLFLGDVMRVWQGFTCLKYRKLTYTHDDSRQYEYAPDHPFIVCIRSLAMMISRSHSSFAAEQGSPSSYLRNSYIDILVQLFSPCSTPASSGTPRTVQPQPVELLICGPSKIHCCSLDWTPWLQWAWSIKLYIDHVSSAWISQWYPHQNCGKHVSFLACN